MWHKDPAVEQLMESIGMKFEYRTSIPLSKLKIKESVEYNARLGDSLDLDRCEKYAYAMQRGVTFPAPVLDWENRVLAGNQRINAVGSIGRKTIDAYVLINATPQQLDDFVRRDNTRHGKGLSEEEMVVTCVELHRKHKTSIKELNDLYFAGNSKTYTKILLANQAKEVEERLINCGVASSQMSTSTLTSMHPIIDNINVLRDTGSLVDNYGLTSTQVDELVKAIREKRTETERLDVVAEHRKTLAQKTKRGSSSVSPTKVLMKEVAHFEKFLLGGYNGKQFPPLDSFVGDKATRDEVRTRLTEISNAIKRLKEKTK